MKIYKGIIANPALENAVRIYRNGALCVDAKGNIIEIANFEDIKVKYPESEIIDFGKNTILPGLIDLHTHLPQYEAVGCGAGQLIDWLNNYTFPLESKFENEDYARSKSDAFFSDLIKNGTTTAFVYTSSQKTAACEAFKSAAKTDLRIFMGMSLMDMNAPDNLIKIASKNIADMRELANCWHKANNGKINYVVTPRFAGSCSLELMKRAADFAKSENLMIQTHLSENKNEINMIQKLFPDFIDYTHIYEECGLITDKTILAHCIHLSEREIKSIKEKGAIIAHCPCSNRFLASGIMPLKKYINNDMKIGLGTDVSGGYSLSVLHEAKEAIENSKLYSVWSEDTSMLIEPEEAICLATIRAAKSIGLDNIIGSFDFNKKADFIVIDTEKTINRSGFELSDRDILSKILYILNTEKTKFVFIDGKAIFENI